MSGRRAKAIRKYVRNALIAFPDASDHTCRQLNQRAKRAYYRGRREGIPCSVLFGELEA